ncbi:hypothetical protein P7K49_013519, partial [Saguinus oedipus]
AGRSHAGPGAPRCGHLRTSPRRGPTLPCPGLAWSFPRAGPRCPARTQPGRGGPRGTEKVPSVRTSAPGVPPAPQLPRPAQGRRTGPAARGAPG